MNALDARDKCARTPVDVDCSIYVGATLGVVVLICFLVRVGEAQSAALLLLTRRLHSALSAFEEETFECDYCSYTSSARTAACSRRIAKLILSSLRKRQPPRRMVSVRGDELNGSVQKGPRQCETVVVD